MKLVKIDLKNFRSYRELSLEFDSDINVLYGENAQGKTNVLEAIYICSCLRSHRTSRDFELIYNEKKEYEINVEFKDLNSSDNYSEEIDILYLESVLGDPARIKNKRIIKHNGIKLSKSSEIMGVFNAVIFAPEDLMLIKEGPSTRRRFLDILISQIRPSYFNELNTFVKILSQRNSLLKQMRDNKAEREYDHISIWDISLAKSAAKIIATRFKFVEKIDEIASKYHKEISYGKEILKVKYKTIAGIANKNSVEEIEEIIISKLKNMFYEDVERGSTFCGPHKDDVEIYLDGDGIKSFSSQGQQRTAVLSMKIAELEIIKNETGKTPVLLLDDVMSELDIKRRRILLSCIGKAQVILTCTDKSHVAEDFLIDRPDRTISYYNVSNSQIERTV